MTARALTKRALCLTVACLVAAPPTGATAQTQMMAGFDPYNPFGSAAQILWQRIQQQCPQLKLPVTIGIASRPVTREAFTTDQGNNIMQQIRAAFSNIPGITMAPWLDIDPIKGIVDTGVLDNPLAGDNKEQLSKIQLEVRASGYKVGAATRFNLSAHGWNGYESCSPSLDPFPVSQDFIGEEYSSTDELFNKVAAGVWAASVDTGNPMTLSVRMLSGLPVSPGWQEFFSDKLRRALSKQNAEEKETKIRAERHVQLVIAHDPASPEDKRWDGMVTVDPRPLGYRISVSVNRRNTTPVSEDGLVTLDELPTMQQWAALGPEAHTPRLDQTPMRINARIEGGRALQQYPFLVAQESYVEVDIPTASVRGPHPAVPVDVLGRNNAQMKTIHIANPSRPNLRRYKLGPGEYTIRVASAGPVAQDFQLRARAVDTKDMLMPEAPGRLLRRFQDWYASVSEDPRTGQRTCYAYTAAQEAGPRYWREQAPFILLQASSAGVGNGDLQHLIEDKRYYKPNTPFEAVIREGGGMVRRLNAAPTAAGNFIRPTKQGSNGQPILDMDAVAGYNRGTTLEIQGTTPDGRPAHVVYSLQGYRAAVNAMSLECGRRDLANALVWK